MSDLNAEQILEPIEVKAVAKVEPQKSLEVSDGEVQIQSLSDFGRQASFMMKTGLVPKSFKNEMEVAGALFTAKSMGLTPNAISEMYYVGGKLTVYGKTLMALVQKSPRYKDWQELFFDKAGKKICLENGNIAEEAFGAMVRVKNKGFSDFVEFFFTQEDARKAGLYKNPTWKSYEKDMLLWKARGRAMSSLFSSEIYGVDLYEAVKYDLEKEVNPINLNDV